MNEDFTHNKKRLYTHYGSIFPNFEDFDKVLTSVFKDDVFNSFVIDTKTNFYRYKSSNVDLQNYKISYPTIINVETDDDNSSTKSPKSNSSKSSKSLKKLSSKSSKSCDNYFSLLKNNKSFINIKINIRNDIITITKDDKKIEIEI